MKEAEKNIAAMTLASATAEEAMAPVRARRPDISDSTTAAAGNRARGTSDEEQVSEDESNPSGVAIHVPKEKRMSDELGTTEIAAGRPAKVQKSDESDGNYHPSQSSSTLSQPAISTHSQANVDEPETGSGHDGPSTDISGKELPPAIEETTSVTTVPEEGERPEMTRHGFDEDPDHADLDVDSNPTETDTDSAVGDMISQYSTASLQSSIYEYIEENGRTYHRYKAGSYMLPNDETEQDRLDLQHHLWLLTLRGELCLAPLQQGIQDVLDIGTGTGIWAIEMANKYPSANVIGTDLSPIQPDYVPPNCCFQVDDVEEDWTFGHKFDYIHSRMMVTCFRSFPAVIAKAFVGLKPGGYIELQDSLPFECYDDSWEGSELKRWRDLCLEAAVNLGMDWRKTDSYRQWLQEAGFQDVVEVKFSQPTNTWARGERNKLLGLWNNQNMLEALHAISIAVLTRGLGMSSQEVEVLLVGARRDLCDKRVHCYSPM
ncbi:MAG: hypothetical protein M1818_003842 [Claussenomyces sp. TS43310]|nr:MAG: hypothetical protein M1818_003842 [Claussenomyces sp. TS43310]